MSSLLTLLKVALLVVLLALPGAGAAGCAIGGESAESKVDWLYDLDDAIVVAQNDNKPVMIDFYANWCAPCKKMDSNTYSDEAMGDFINENFAPLKVNVDKSNLDGVYGISSIPQLVFLSPEGTEIDRKLRIIGYVPPDSFQSRLQAVLDAWNTGIQ